MAHLIIGCGYLGQHVARLWRDQGKRVMALTRGRSDELRAQGIEPIVGDVMHRSSLTSLPEAEVVLYAVGFDRSAGRSFREVYVEGARNVLSALPAPGRLIYVSTTSVYGQMNGEEVDETSPTEPREPNGRAALDAENVVRDRRPEAMVLRFAGIYGPGRVLRRIAIEKGESFAGDREKWLNLIQVEDGAKAIAAAAERGSPGETYLVSDGSPVRRREFYAYMAELLGAPPPVFSPGPTDEGGNRRVSNRKMIEFLGVLPRYPDYRAGLRAAI